MHFLGEKLRAMPPWGRIASMTFSIKLIDFTLDLVYFRFVDLLLLVNGQVEFERVVRLHVVQHSLRNSKLIHFLNLELQVVVQQTLLLVIHESLVDFEKVSNLLVAVGLPELLIFENFEVFKLFDKIKNCF